MKRIQLCLAMLAVMTLALSCSKEKSQLESRTEMLINKDWQQTAFLADTDQDGNPETNIFGFMAECDKDDLTFYSQDGSWQHKEGFTKCNADDPDVITKGNWQLDETGTSLKVTDGSLLLMDATIIDMTQTELRITFMESGSTFTSTYKSR
ncbi:MAG: hypothetical protein AAF990_06350 [Bacteroidota bacterium]